MGNDPIIPSYTWILDVVVVEPLPPLFLVPSDVKMSPRPGWIGLDWIFHGNEASSHWGTPHDHGNHVTCSGGHRIHGDMGGIDDLGLGWLMDSLK